MDLHDFNRVFDAVPVGQIYLNTKSNHLEAFSGNGLYCWRGMPTMNKYKTVKEVCALTGLTRKHLYYFHHEKVVQAVAYANYSVEGYNGYKLYDEAAVEKLQQIALYYQLGLKRDEIKDIMLSPDYDSNTVLQTLLAVEQEKKIHIERHIAALEYLVLAGTKNGVSGSLRGISLEDLGRTLLALRETSADKPSAQTLTRGRAEIFAREFEKLICELAGMDEAALKTPAGAAVIRRIFDLGKEHLGADGAPFLLGVFISVLGEGSAAQGVADQLTPSHGRAVLQYMIDHPQFLDHTPCATAAGGTDKNRRKSI